MSTEPVSDSIVYNYAFLYAAEHGDLEIVKELLNDPRVNIHKIGRNALRLAAVKKHLDIVKLLIADERLSWAEDDKLSTWDLHFFEHYRGD